MNYEITMNRVVFLFYISLFGISLQCFSINDTSNKTFNTPQSDTLIINLRDFGLERIRKKDCTKIITKALKELHNSTPVIIRFPRGEYHFYAEESSKHDYFIPNSTQAKTLNCAILIENQNNIIIDGNGSTLIFHGQIQPFTFVNCQNITINNFKIDWEQPLLAQGKVVKVNEEFIELAVDLKESPYSIENGKLYFNPDINEKESWKNTVEFDRENRYIVPQTGDMECLGKGWGNYAAENIIPGVIRFYYPFLRKPEIGNFLVMQYAEKNHSGISIYESKNITVKNVTIYHAAGVGILAQNSGDLTFSKYRAVPNKIKNRYFSGNDGGLYLSNCNGNITIDNCEFEGLMNSPVNIQAAENIPTIPKISITNSQFKNSWASGICFSTPGKIVIENNIFESSGSAILIADDANNDLKSASVTDVLIENNDFNDLCNSGSYQLSEAVISIYPGIPDFNENTVPLYKNIRITNNRFNPFDYPVLFARSAENLTFENNSIKRSTRFEPFHSRQNMFSFEGCRNIFINNNTISENVLGKNILLKWMSKSEISGLQPELNIR